MEKLKKFLQKKLKKCLTLYFKSAILYISKEREVKPMNKKDIVELKMKFLREFDTYIREVIGDDSITYDVWCAYGLPDEYDDDDIYAAATDEELWLDCVEAFSRCLALAK